jgi:hypothetical protein
VATSKFKDFKGFGEVQDGRILLQDHGNLVSFRISGSGVLTAGLPLFQTFYYLGCLTTLRNG